VIAPATVRRVIRDYALSIFAWLTMSLLTAWQTWNMSNRENLHVTLRDMLLLYAVRYFTVALLTPPIFYLSERWPFRGRKAWLRVFAWIIGYIPFAIAFGTIRWCFLPPWMEDTQSWGPRNLDTLGQVIYTTFADVLFLYLGIVIAAHAYTYYVRDRRHEIDHLQLSRALAQSELQALKFQLHPHFLFNTLQGISTLVDTDKRAAQAMILKLSRLLRVALKHGSADLIPLSDEIEFAESYLDLQKMRLGKRLEVRWDVEPETRSALVPQLILQPLIENAVVHGIACYREGGWIEIRSRAGDILTLEIRNSVGGRSEKGLGLGLQNTSSRLKYLYNSEASFKMEILPEGIAVATLRVPSFLGRNAEDNPSLSTLEV
jgi:two-component system, LytTR family, sensor kinase